MKISMIAAVGKNLELGKDNELIWRIKEDLKYFKETTLHHTVVMGDNTYYSIGKPLPERNNIVLSFNETDIPGVTILDDYKKVLEMDTDDEIFIIGGATIYKLFAPYADNLYLTEIDDEDPSADCYFPSFDKEKYNKEIIKESSLGDLKFTYTVYRKKNE